MDEQGRYIALAIVLAVLFFVGLAFAPSTSTTVPTKPVPLPPAAQLQQRHPNWSIYHCQQIVDGVISTGMTKGMVILSAGSPDREIASKGQEILSYYHGGTLFNQNIPCIGIRHVVILENNVVTNVSRTSIYTANLNNCVGWSENTVRLLYGPQAAYSKPQAAMCGRIIPIRSVSMFQP